MDTLYQTQDHELSKISQVLKILKGQAHDMNNYFELEEPLLQDLDHAADRTTDKVKHVNKKIDHLKKAESSGSLCCVIC